MWERVTGPEGDIKEGIADKKDQDTERSMRKPTERILGATNIEDVQPVKFNSCNSLLPRSWGMHSRATFHISSLNSCFILLIIRQPPHNGIQNVYDQRGHHCLRVATIFVQYGYSV